jgi:hypothetical protein
MCTVTAICPPPSCGGAARPLMRLTCNRDEQRSREASTGPVFRSLKDRRAVMPIDPPSNGTWIGANDAGIVACLLNGNPARGPGARRGWPERLSRGRIVPDLLAADSLEGAFEVACEIDADDFPSFRALVLADGRHFVAYSDGRSIHVTEPVPLGAPLMLTSSGLGDALVDPPRRALFRLMLLNSPDVLRSVASFHAHRWPDRPHVSVLMSRPDARTVSRTIVDLHADAIELVHRRLDDGLHPADGNECFRLGFNRTEVAA